MDSRRLPLVFMLAAMFVGLPAAGQGDGAAAQPTQLQVEVDPVPLPIEPLSDPVNTTVTVEVPCGTGGEDGSRAVDVDVTSKPDWVTATVSPATVHVDTSDCDGTNGTAQDRTWLEAGLTAHAPAFEPANVTLQASSDGLEPGTDHVRVEAAFYAVFDAQTSRPVVVAEPQSQLDLEVQMTNYGNGPVEVTPTVVGGSGGLKAVLPAAFMLGSNATGGPNQRTLVVSVQTPFQNGYVNQEDRLEVRWTAGYAPNASAGGTNTTTAFTVQTKGFHVPGASPALAVLALTGVAAAARRRDP